MTSGRTRTYAEKQAAGITRVSAELDRQTLARLDEICRENGVGRADMIRAMIDSEWTELRSLRQTPKSKKPPPP